MNVPDLDWFQRFTGFKETDYLTTRARLSASMGAFLLHTPAGSYPLGYFSLPSLRDYLDAMPAPVKTWGALLEPRMQWQVGRAFELHHDPENDGAVFQVASQFNCLEHVASDIGPEYGVTGYVLDDTQGPACALATPAVQ